MFAKLITSILLCSSIFLITNTVATPTPRRGGGGSRGGSFTGGSSFSGSSAPIMGVTAGIRAQGNSISATGYSESSADSYPNTCNLPLYQFNKLSKTRRTGFLHAVTKSQPDQCLDGWVRATDGVPYCLEPCGPNYVNEGNNCKLDESKCPPKKFVTSSTTTSSASPTPFSYRTTTTSASSTGTHIP